MHEFLIIGSGILALLLIPSALAVYFLLRFGPKRCPKCRSWTWGFPGVPIGVRRWHFHCKRCGTYFEGHFRLPM